MMHNNITYRGHVTIKIKNRPPVRKHNEGTSLLFSTICELLSAYISRDSVKLPSYISFVSVPVDPQVPVYDASASLLLTELNITSRYIKRDDNSCIFSALLPNSLIDTSSTGSLGNENNITIVLLTQDKQLLAYSNIKYGEISTVASDQNSQAVIEWTLSFNNKEDVTNE